MTSSKRGLKADTAYRILKRAIVSAKLAPGSQVSEAGLVEAFGLGRASVRVALERLSHENLVESLPRKGYVIAPITVKDVTELYDLRLILEPYAARMAAHAITQEQVNELSDLCSLSIDLSNPDCIDDYLRRNTQFHLAVARASGNDRLATIIAGLLDAMERVFRIAIMQLPDVDDIFQQHRRLVELLAVGDGNLAEQHEIARITASRNMFIEKLLSPEHARFINLVRRDYQAD